METDEPFFGSYPSGDATHGANREDELQGLASLAHEYGRRWALSPSEVERDVLRTVRGR